MPDSKQQPGPGSDLIASISAVNLVMYVPVWRVLLQHPDAYLLHAPADPRFLWAGVLALVGGSALSFALLRALRAHAAGEYCMLAALVIFLGRHVDYLVLAPWIGDAACELVALALIAVALLAFWKRRQMLFHAARAALLITAPIALVTTGNAIAQIRAAPLYKPLLPASPPVTKCEDCPLVLWVIFDEWDQKYGFESVPEGIDVSRALRFRETAFWASAAYPPASETYLSLPALVTGRLVKEAMGIGPRTLMLAFGDPQGNTIKETEFSEVPNYFTRMHELGYESALIGFLIPYCRIISQTLQYCKDDHLFSISPDLAEAGSLWSAIAYVTVRISAGTRPPGLTKPLKWWQRGTRELLENDLMRVLNEKRYRNIFFHTPLPHPPRAAGGDYFDSLEDTSELIARIKDKLESTGQWDDAVVLLSTDHHWRIGDWCTTKRLTERERTTSECTTEHRIPFILKLPGQHESMVYEQPFNTVLSGAMLEAIGRRDLKTPADVAAWIDATSRLGRSPYHYGSPINPWIDQNDE